MPMQIRRDRSALRYGGRTRRRHPLRRVLLGLILAGLVIAGLWQLTPMEARVAALINGNGVPTPDPINLAQQADIAFQRGQMADSIDLYRQAADLAPQDIGIQYEYVRALIYGSYSVSQPDALTTEALEAAQRLVDAQPNDARTQAAYALALTARDHYDQAAAAARRAMELNSRWAEPHAYLALAYLGQQRWTDALETARQSVEINPDSVDARRAYALALASTGQYGRAIEQYQRAIQLQPRLYALYFELAQYYIFDGDFDSAIQAYDRIISNDPRNVKAWTRKCQAYHRQREDANARESCEQAIEMDPSSVEAHMQLGIVLYYGREYDHAIQTFNQCVFLMESQNWPMETRLSQCYYVQGLAHYLHNNNCASAIPLFEEAFLTNLSAQGRQKTLEGLESCTGQPVDEDDLPAPGSTPAPESTPTPEGIGIY